MGIRKRFVLIIVSLMVSAFALLLVPFSIKDDGTLNVLGYLAGGLFWTGLIGGIAGYMNLLKKYKRKLKRRSSQPKEKTDKLPGLQFFSNPPAKVVDVIMMAALVGTIYCISHAGVDPYVAILVVVLAIITIYAHFLLNGKVYRYIWNKQTKKYVAKEGAEN